ncbi:hypothetical protein [Synechococcus sp. PCC 6312]|uniref:hypothetical protein n=1 Tax=Synechococcus sp. (strain ATCC 27167 / PCC 6312) TaxID=195253 RepID=UPI00059DB87B|nr:hypothetical protein [Synechococcus sp. PCC 6312]
MLRVPNELLPQVKKLIEVWRGPGNSTVLMGNLSQAIEATQQGQRLARGLEGDALKLIQDSLPVRVVLDHPGRVSDVYELGGETVRVRYGEVFQLPRPQVSLLQAKLETLNRNSFNNPITLRVLA